MDQECVSDFFREPPSFNTHNIKENCIEKPLLESQTIDSDGCSTVGLSQESNTQLSTDSDSDDLHLSQLEIEEVEPLYIPHFFNMSPRTMPVSPHHVFEEEFSNNPWILLVATIFLTKTSGKTARPFMKKFFDEFPTPYHVIDAHPSRLESFFETLGLRKRGQMIWKMSYQFVSAKWRRASDLCGVGKYGEDAYRIFCLGHTDVDPGDRYLRLYLDWLRGHTHFLLDSGVQDSEHVIEDPVLKYYSFTLRELNVKREVTTAMLCST